MMRISPRRIWKRSNQSLPLSLALVVALALVAASCGSSLDSAANDDSAAPSSAEPAGTVEASPVEESDPAPSTTTSAAPATTTTTTSTTTTTTTIATTTTTTAIDCAALLPLEHRIGQLMFPVMVQDEFAIAADLARDGLLGGVVVLGAPDVSIANDIRAYQEASLFGDGIIAVDEEGGRVQRLTSLTSALPSAGTVAETLTLDEAAQLAQEHAIAIGELGFTMNLAPVVDLNNGTFIGDRSFGADPGEVTDYAFATADGIIAAGLDPVVKHFPGHGRGIDSHTGLPTIPGVETLQGSDLIPFVEAVDRGDLPIMIGHLIVEDLTDGLPASVSPAAVDGLLRTDIGFDGLVMTDALNMDAISTTLNNAEAAELSLAAGVDLIMLGSIADTELTVERIVEAVADGRITEQSINESVIRVMDTRGIGVCDLAS